MPRRRLVVSSIFLVATLACGSAEPGPGAHPKSGADYTFVFLKTGPATGLSSDELRAVGAGHFANMKRLADEGHLLLAGPLGPPRVDPGHRGVFVFDTDDPEQARRLAGTDPGAEAGVFVFELHPWRGPVALRDVPRLDAAAREGLPADAGPGAGARPWVLVRCDDAERARNALAPLVAEGAVPLFGELTAEEPRGAIFVLDARDLDGAASLLARAGQVPDGFWQLHPWFATEVLSEIAPVGRAAR